MAPNQPAEAMSWRDRLAALAGARRFLAMVWETSPILTLATTLVRLVRAFLPVAILWVSKLILDGIVGLLIRRSGSAAHIAQLLALEFGLAAVSGILARTNSLLDSLLGDRFITQVGVRLMRHAAELDLAAFEDPVFHDKLDRARRRASGRLTLLASLLDICEDVVTLALLSGGLIAFSPWLMVLLIAAVLPAFFGEAHFSRLSYSILYRRTPERRSLDYLCFLGASAQSAKEVKVFGLAGHLSQRYQDTSDAIVAENKAVAVKKTVVASALGLVSTGGYYGVYALVLVRTIAGAISVGTFTFLTRAFSRSRDCIERVLTGFDDVSEQAVFLKDLFDFFEMKPSIQSVPNALPAPRPIREGFAFENVSFAYPGCSELVLRNVAFRLRPGERIALIGENGAGKTTLVKLLARLYDPTSGRILLDGVDLREYSVEELHHEIGVIFQDYVRYDMPVRENIGFGRIESLSDQRRIEAAAAKSLAKAVIERLPNGYDQMVGRRFEGGLDLSGGEWQKFALARAYMREAQLLILDEPTATLDARAEHEAFRRFAELVRGRMAVLISHRFSTVRMADRILVLADGAIEEQGTHDQLVDAGGRYAELFNLQAAGYR